MQFSTAHPLVIYGLLAAIGLTGALGDLWIYKWAVSDKTIWLVWASVVWLASLILFGVMIRLDSRSFSAAFMLVSLFHAVVVVVCDLAFFGGRLNRVEWLGLLLALVSVLVLEFGKEESVHQPGSGALEFQVDQNK